jgi:hypothetical protein
MDFSNQPRDGVRWRAIKLTWKTFSPARLGIRDRRRPPAQQQEILLRSKAAARSSPRALP